MSWGWIWRSLERVSVGEGGKGFPCKGFLSEREGKVFHAEGRKTEKVGTNSGKSGTRNLEAEYQKQSREYGRVCKVEDAHRVLRCFWLRVSLDRRDGVLKVLRKPQLCHMILKNTLLQLNYPQWVGDGTTCILNLVQLGQMLIDGNVFGSWSCFDQVNYQCWFCCCSEFIEPWFGCSFLVDWRMLSTNVKMHVYLVMLDFHAQ